MTTQNLLKTINTAHKIIAVNYKTNYKMTIKEYSEPFVLL